MNYKSKDTAFNGIWLWVQDNKHELIKDKPINKEVSNLKKIIKKFLIENNINHKKQISSNYSNVQTQLNFKKI